MVSDFRPISLLPLLSKVLEKFVARYWILPFILKKMHNSEFAYIPGPGSGTICALPLVYDRILRFLDRSGAVRVLSIDFAKAFDKIPHASIIDAALRFHLPAQAITWISSFLSDRQQRVRFGETFSCWSTITSGVPQGSVLSPILFCMVVNDFSSVCSNSLCVKYADDFTILHFVRYNNDEKLQLEWDTAVEWAECQNLPINIQKCSVMNNIITKKDLILSPICASHDFEISNVPCVTILGVTFSNDLKWNIHIDKTISKVSRRFFILYNLVKARCPPSVLKMFIMPTFVQSF